MGKTGYLLFLLCTFSMFLVTSCSSPKNKLTSTGETQLEMADATLLQIFQAEQFDRVVIKNPWDTTHVLATYILLPDSIQQVPQNLPEGIVLRTPLKRAAIGSVVHLNLWYAFDSRSKVKAVCDAKFITDSYWKKALENGTLIDLGTTPNIDIEKLVHAQCDALLLSTFQGMNYDNIRKTGIPLVECADYMETSPLGRAEWIRFYGRLMGKATLADSMFTAIRSKYLSLKKQVENVKEKPTVFMDLMYSGSWYQPGGNSTMGWLIHDAGGKYIFADTKQNGSLQLSFEQVLQRAQKADIWLIRYMGNEPLTYSSIAKTEEKYSLFDAWKQHHVYACNTTQTQFFEQTPFHPEELLANFIYLFHPEVVAMASHPYFSPLP